MIRYLYIGKVMDGFPETLITMFGVVLTAEAYDILGIAVLVLAGFFWTLRIKREIQQQYQNRISNAIKSLFKRWTRYGENGEPRS